MSSIRLERTETRTQLTRYNVTVTRFTRCKVDMVAFHTRQALRTTPGDDTVLSCIATSKLYICVHAQLLVHFFCICQVMHGLTLFAISSTAGCCSEVNIGTISASVARVWRYKNLIITITIITSSSHQLNILMWYWDDPVEIHREIPY